MHFTILISSLLALADLVEHQCDISLHWTLLVTWHPGYQDRKGMALMLQNGLHRKYYCASRQPLMTLTLQHFDISGAVTKMQDALNILVQGASAVSYSTPCGAMSYSASRATKPYVISLVCKKIRLLSDRVVTLGFQVFQKA